MKVKFCVLQVAFLQVVSWSSDSIITSYVITESSVLLAKDFPFSQLHVVEFQT